MSKRYEKELKEGQFQTGDAAYFIDVSPRTIRRWAKGKHMKYTMDKRASWRLFSADEINRMRVEKGLNPLSDQEMRQMFFERHPTIKENLDY